jgi:uncharacterized protein YggT (Ycf19 family)
MLILALICFVVAIIAWLSLVVLVSWWLGETERPQIGEFQIEVKPVAVFFDTTPPDFVDPGRSDGEMEPETLT